VDESQLMQQALAYAELLDAPFAISSDGFLLHDRTSLSQPVERSPKLDTFPPVAELWPLCPQWKGRSVRERHAGQEAA
jgi:type I restriction enzyme R subunit